MNDTVAVALVTSLSTLAAAGLTGAVAALQTARQLRHQLALAREERAEQRAERRRELRREVYERFLVRTDEAYRVLDEGWHAAPFTHKPRWEAGFAARRAMDEALVRVLMEGPEEVARRGREVIDGVGAEFRLHGRVVAALGEDTQRCAASADPSARRQALEVRFRTNADFVAAVRRAVEAPADDAQDVRGCRLPAPREPVRHSSADGEREEPTGPGTPEGRSRADRNETG